MISMILRFLFFVFLFFLIYKLVFDFIIPIYKTTKRVKQGFREMHEKMQQNMNGSQPQHAPKATSNKNEHSGDYIDFEEVKE